MIKLDLNPPANQLRQFAWFGLFGFPLIGLVTVTWKAWLPDWALFVFLGLGAAMGLAALINLSAVIKPVYVVMMLIAFPIGMILSTVLLGLIYYGMFTPVGFLFRLTGRDPLDRKPDPGLPTYWHVRETQRPPASYLRLY